APLVARAVAEQIERRVSHRRAIKQAALRAMQRGAQGVRIRIAGRLGGSDMSRRDQERQGRVPLHTLKADVDYGTAEARTTLGRRRGMATAGNHVTFGDYGLQALGPCWLTARQIEAGRRAITRYVRRGGKLWIRVFPDKPITKKPLEVRQGSGKGPVEAWVAVVRPGRMIYEIAGVQEETAREAMRLAAHKLPIPTRFVARPEM